MSGYQVLNELKPPWDYAVTADGRIFFINEATRQTTWLCPLTGRPLQSGYVSRPNLPPGWEVGITADSRPYFVNHIERTSTFEEPRGRPPTEVEPRTAATQPNASDALRRSRSRSPSGLLRLGSRSSRRPSVRSKRNESSLVEVSGWLLHKHNDAFGTKWKERFSVMSDFTLYLYKEAGDSEAVDSVALAGYRVLVDQPTANAKRFPIRLLHDNQPTVELAAASDEERQRWCAALQRAARLEPVRAAPVQPAALRGPPPPLVRPVPAFTSARVSTNPFEPAATWRRAGPPIAQRPPPPKELARAPPLSRGRPISAVSNSASRSSSIPRLNVPNGALTLVPVDIDPRRSQPSLHPELQSARMPSPVPSTATFSRMPGTLRRAIGRVPLTESDLAGKSREEVTLLLIQYRRDQAKLLAARREYEDRVQRLRQVEETQRARGLPNATAANERAHADAELRAITTQLAVNQPVVRLLDSLVKLAAQAEAPDAQTVANGNGQIETDWRRGSAPAANLLAQQQEPVDPVERELLPIAVRDVSAVLQELKANGAQLESFMQSLRSNYAALVPTNMDNERDEGTYFETDLDSGRTVDLAAPASREADSSHTPSGTLDRSRIRSSIKRRHHLSKDALKFSEARSRSNSVASTPRHSLARLDTDTDSYVNGFGNDGLPSRPATAMGTLLSSLDPSEAARYNWNGTDTSGLNSPTASYADVTSVNSYGFGQQRVPQTNDPTLAKLTVRDIKKRLEERKRDYIRVESDLQRQRSLPRNWRSSSTSSLPVELSRPLPTNAVSPYDQRADFLLPSVAYEQPRQRESETFSSVSNGFASPYDRFFNSHVQPAESDPDADSVAKQPQAPVTVSPVKVDAVLLTLTDPDHLRPVAKESKRLSRSLYSDFPPPEQSRPQDDEITGDVIDKSISVPDPLRITSRYLPSDSDDEFGGPGKSPGQPFAASHPPFNQSPDELRQRDARVESIRRMLATHNLQYFTSDELYERSDGPSANLDSHLLKERECHREALSLTQQLANEASQRTRQLAAARKERRKTWSGVQADRLLRLSSDVDELLDSADALTDTLHRTRRLFDYPTSTTLL